MNLTDPILPHKCLIKAEFEVTVKWKNDFNLIERFYRNVFIFLFHFFAELLISLPSLGTRAKCKHVKIFTIGSEFLSAEISGE